MSFSKPGELVSKATYRSYTNVSVREFRLCCRIKVVILIFILKLFRVIKTQFLSYTAYFYAYLKSRYTFFLIFLQNIKKWGAGGVNIFAQYCICMTVAFCKNSHLAFAFMFFLLKYESDSNLNQTFHLKCKARTSLTGVVTFQLLQMLE